MVNEKKKNLPTDVCPHLETCTIIQNQHKMPGLAERFRQAYCFDNHTSCCRRWIRDFLGAEKVPELMLPYQRDWAQQILIESGIGYAVFRQTYLTPQPRKAGEEK